MNQPVPIEDKPSLRFFGDEMSCGDGQSPCYIGDTPGAVADAVARWIESGGESERGLRDGETMTITARLMTQAQIDALPSL
jgi:hypothetical protein